VNEGTNSATWYTQALPNDTSLLILHPNFANQHMLLTSVLEQNGKPALFLMMPAQAEKLDQIWPTLADALQEQGAGRLPALEGRTTPIQAAQLTLKALEGLGTFKLVVDAFDQASGEVEDWIVALTEALPRRSQIIISTREAPLRLLENESLHGKLQFYPVAPERLLLDYTAQDKQRPLLEVYALGPGQVLINGRRIDRWDGLLPRSLLFYFVDRGMVTRDEIFKTFWPTLSMREATNVFHVTKRKISEILGFDLTTYWSGFYRISPDVDLCYDAVKFVEDVQNSDVAAEDEAISLLERAVYLYRGLFLNTLDMPWAESRRTELGQTYTDALFSLGKLRQRRGEAMLALGLFLRAAAIQPHREDLARGIMSLYAEIGQRKKAVEVYDRLARELKHSFGVSPDKQTIEMIDQIRKR